MKTKACLTSILLCCCSLLVSTVSAQQRDKVINVLTPSTGEKIRGPVIVKPIRVNRLRYKIEIKKDTTFTPGPSLTLPFIPPVPEQKAQQATPPSQTGEGAASQDDIQALKRLANGDVGALVGKPPDEQFQIIVIALNNYEARRVNEIQTPIAEAIRVTNEARDDTYDFVEQSDANLQAGPSIVLAGIDPVVARIEGALTKVWPDASISDLLGDLAVLKNALRTIPPGDWLTNNKTIYDYVDSRIDQLHDLVDSVRSTGAVDASVTKFAEVQRKLRQWKSRFAGLQAQGESAFSYEAIPVDCSFAFSDNKETKLTLIKQDLLAPRDTDPIRQELITVVCSSPFSISGGFAFSSVNEREFVFVPSTKTVTENGQQVQKVINRLGFKNNSSFRPIPLLLLNTRVHEWNDDIALHLSAGAGVDLKTGEAGTDVEYVVGPSISFKRSMFITAGAHIARVPKLAGGFQLDQEVPEGISAPPIEKAWKTGFIISFTYKLK
jgi:hypothetical protein